MSNNTTPEAPSEAPPAPPSTAPPTREELDLLSPNSRLKKMVQWADSQVQVHDVVKRRSQMSRQSMQGIWFEGEDFEAFVEDMEKCVDKMESGQRLKDKKYSSLGLESLTEEGSAIRQANQEDAWDAVLGEQEQQWKEGRRSSIDISIAYQRISEYSAQYAHELAQAFHEELESYLNHSKDDIDMIFDKLHISKKNDLLLPEEHQKAERRRSSSLPRAGRVSFAAY